MRTRLFATFIMLGIMLSGCTTPTPTPAPTATPTAPIVPVTPNGYPPEYPPRPTSTPYAEETAAEDNVYFNGDYGLRVPYPDRWMNLPPQEGDGVVQYFIGDGGSITSGFLVNPSGGESLEDIGSAIRDEILSDLQDLSVVSDQADRLQDGRPAWTTIATAKREDGSELKIQLTTALNGSRAYTLFVFGEPQDFDNNKAEIASFATGWKLETPRLYGLPRDQMLVVAGGESTNPRE
jgi:hypothetical protein